MLDEQFEQTGKRDENIFMRCLSATGDGGGFNWSDTIEKFRFWCTVIGSRKKIT